MTTPVNQTPFAAVDQEVPGQEPLLRVTDSPSSRRFYRLQPGRAGNLQTAAIMANLVRDAAVKDKDLELFAVKILTSNGLDSHSDPYEVADAMLRYVQKLTYVSDPAGSFDSVQSARQVIREGKGDCDDLSVLLASLLALIGFKPRFVMARYRQETEGFDHVYVDLELPRGRVALDPSSRKHGIGWENSRALERVAYPIFDGRVVGLGDLAAQAARVFKGFSGCDRTCDSSCGCASGNVTATAAGSGVVTTSLTLPALLFGIGITVAALKVANWLDS